MPTSRSTSTERSVICRPDIRACAASTSSNWAPIDMTGLSAFIALCMTTE